MDKFPLYESEKVEFKTTFNSECIETLVAFANAKGGSVYIGMKDDGSVVGVSLEKETTIQWINEIKTKTEPSVIPDVDIVDSEGKNIVVLSIKEFPVKPVSVRGKYFKRIGNSNHLLNLNEILNMHIQTFNSSWDYYYDANHNVSDISEEKASRLIALYNKNREIPVENDVYEFLSKMELIREGKLTHAAFLLLMKNESIISTIELGHFQDDITIKDGITISTDLLSEVEEVLAFIRKHINKAFIITGNPAREERWDYPLDALREIVMNMIVHRDYTHFGDSSVKIFANRIEFFNPGRLPDSISEDNLRKGNYISTCRNKLVSKIFKEIGWIEKYGSGIKRVTNLFREYGSPLPVFENFQHGFKVIAFPLEKNMEEDIVNAEENAEKTVEKNRKTVVKIDGTVVKKGEGNGKTVVENGKTVVEKGETVAKTEGAVEKNGKTVVKTEGTVEKTEGTVVKKGEEGKTVVKTVVKKGGKNGKTVVEKEKTVEKILDFIENNPKITRLELAKKTGLSQRGIEWNLAKLKAESIVERVGANKGGYWKINKNNL